MKNYCLSAWELQLCQRIAELSHRRNTCVCVCVCVSERESETAGPEGMSPVQKTRLFKMNSTVTAALHQQHCRLLQHNGLNAGESQETHFIRVNMEHIFEHLCKRELSNTRKIEKIAYICHCSLFILAPRRAKSL